MEQPTFTIKLDPYTKVYTTHHNSTLIKTYPVTTDYNKKQRSYIAMKELLDHITNYYSINKDTPMCNLIIYNDLNLYVIVNNIADSLVKYKRPVGTSKKSITLMNAMRDSYPYFERINLLCYQCEPNDINTFRYLLNVEDPYFTKDNTPE